MTTATLAASVPAPAVSLTGTADQEAARIRVAPQEEVSSALAPAGLRSGAMPVVNRTRTGAEILVGVPSEQIGDVERVRTALAEAAAWLGPVDAVSVELSGLMGTADDGSLVYAVVGGLLDGISTRDGGRWPDRITLRGTPEASGAKLLESAVTAVQHARATRIARELVDATPSQMFPAALAERAAGIGRDAGLEVEVWGPAELEREGMGGVLAVGRGSERPPYLLQLRYLPAQQQPAARHVVLVGKGITFDSGGLSLKSPDAMMDMKSDMAGAAAIIGAMAVLGELAVPHRVTAILPLAENLPGPSATRVGDVVRTRSGLTIEVLNSDFEGRVLLSDALTLAGELAPDAIVDLATLTESAVRALGPEVAALFASDDALAEAVAGSGTETGEQVWRMPLLERYEPQLHSQLADLRNFPGSPHARSITAALFLRRFVPAGIPWAHLDMAGPAMRGTPPEAAATGFGARLLCRLLAAGDSTTTTDNQHSPEKGSR